MHCSYTYRIPTIPVNTCDIMRNSEQDFTFRSNHQDHIWEHNCQNPFIGLTLQALCPFLIFQKKKKDASPPLKQTNLFSRSLSFILVLAGMAFLLLTLMYLIIDVGHLWLGTPFLYVGMNPILVHPFFLLGLLKMTSHEIVNFQTTFIPFFMHFNLAWQNTRFYPLL